MLPKKPFAEGRTAEMYDWKPGLVLKLYREWCPPGWVEYEARIARAVDAAGVSAPHTGEIVEIDGRRGIEYERVNGPSMIEALAAQWWKLPALARRLAALHLEMHAAQPQGLPRQRDNLRADILKAQDLPGALKKKALDRLDSLPDGDRLCHGDFHPGNVLISPGGAVVIDWMTACAGHPAADVARTRLLLSVGDPPGGFLLRLLVFVMRGLLYRIYLSEYRRRSPEVVRLSDAYLPILAAARLSENITPERDPLLRIVER